MVPVGVRIILKHIANMIKLSKMSFLKFFKKTPLEKSVKITWDQRMDMAIKTGAFTEDDEIHARLWHLCPLNERPEFDNAKNEITRYLTYDAQIEAIKFTCQVRKGNVGKAKKHLKKIQTMKTVVDAKYGVVA